MKKWITALAIGIGAAAWGAPQLSPLTAIDVNGKTILANAQGMTVYTFDPDKPGQSNCNAGCAKEWPPVLVPEGTVLTPPVAAITRKDGAVQVTYNGHPVYTYVDDSAPRQTTGDGLGGIWHIVLISPK